MSFIKMQIIGNLGGDPELRYTQTGTAVCSFSVAANETWKDRATGERKERTTWVRVTCWNALAENVNQYLAKGRRVFVEGRPGVSAWGDKNGDHRATLELTASEVKFLDSASNGNGNGGSTTGMDSYGPPPPESMQDIPF